MSEWWTYHLSRLPALLAAHVLPAVRAVQRRDLAGADRGARARRSAILALAAAPGGARGRVIAAVLAACWLWVGDRLPRARYATINWAAVYFAVGFARRGGAPHRDRRRGGRLSSSGRRISRRGWDCAIFLFALALEPLVGPLLGRAWTAGRGLRRRARSDGGRHARHPARRERPRGGGRSWSSRFSGARSRARRSSR